MSEEQIPRQDEEAKRKAADENQDKKTAKSEMRACGSLTAGHVLPKLGPISKQDE